MSGAFDRFGERGVMLANIDHLLAYNKELVSGITSSQDSLFAGISEVQELVLVPSDKATPEQKLQWERDLLGVYVSGHPLDSFRDELKKRTSISEIKQAVEQKQEMNVVRMKGEVTTAGMIETVKELLTKKGDRMAFVQLSNHTDSIEMVTFPEVFQANREFLVPGMCVAIKGKLNIRNDEPTLLIDKMKALAPVTKEIDNQPQ